MPQEIFNFWFVNLFIEIKLILSLQVRFKPFCGDENFLLDIE